MPKKLINGELVELSGQEISEFNNRTKRPVTVDDVNREASKRVLSIFPEWKQRNAIARSVELHQKQLEGQPLTTEEEAEVVTLKGLWDNVKLIRSKSNVLSSMNVIPMDYVSDSYWRD